MERPVSGSELVGMAIVEHEATASVLEQEAALASPNRRPKSVEV